MLYNFEKSRIEYYDGLTLILVQPDTSVLTFNDVTDLNINGNGISFRGKYQPSIGEIVGFTYKDSNGDDCDINVIYLERDNNNIRLYYDLNLPSFNNLETSIKYVSTKDGDFIPISNDYFKIIIDELREKGYVYDNNNLIIIKCIWKPLNNEDYWYVMSQGLVNHTLCDYLNRFDKSRIDIGNCFKTESEAQKAADAFIKWFKTYRQLD